LAIRSESIKLRAQAQGGIPFLPLQVVTTSRVASPWELPNILNTPFVIVKSLSHTFHSSLSVSLFCLSLLSLSPFSGFNSATVHGQSVAQTRGAFRSVVDLFIFNFRFRVSPSLLFIFRFIPCSPLLVLLLGSVGFNLFVMLWSILKSGLSLFFSVFKLVSFLLVLGLGLSIWDKL